MEDLADSSRYAIYGVAGQFGSRPTTSTKMRPDRRGWSPNAPISRRYWRSPATTGGGGPDRDLAIALETELHAAELTPVESADPRNIYHPLPFADVRAQIPELDLGLYFEAIGYPQPERIIQTEPRYLPVLSRMLRERSLQDFKDHAALMLVLKYQGVLTTEFEEPTRALVEVLTGTPVLPPRDERALALVTEKLGHPVSRLYPAIRRELVHRR